MKPSWFQVARRPKWLGALLLALSIAAIFALLGQWQLDRSFPRSVEDPKADEVVALVDIEKPAEPLQAGSAYRNVTANIYLDLQNVYIIKNRYQLEDGNRISGYWLISNSAALLSDGDKTASLTVALGFAKTLSQAEQAREQLKSSVQPDAFLPVSGKYLPSEAPQAISEKRKPYLLESLSLAQLVNLYSPEPVESFAGFLVRSGEAGFGLDPIALEVSEPTQVNWLTLFYAVEWALFALFAIFLWWRLVEDQRIRETNISKR